MLYPKKVYSTLSIRVREWLTIGKFDEILTLVTIVVCLILKKLVKRTRIGVVKCSQVKVARLCVSGYPV